MKETSSNNSNIRIRIPFDRKQTSILKAGDTVLITGTVYTARDAAHKKMTEAINNGEPLPFEIRDSIIYYVGPAPARPDKVIGSAGPTTSGRMDAYAPQLLDLGLRGMIGKGARNPNVVDAIIRNESVYFAAIGGCAAVIADCIKSAEVIAYEELGTEAVRKLEVEDFPAIVAIDSKGNNYYDIGRIRYLSEKQS